MNYEINYFWFTHFLELVLQANMNSPSKCVVSDNMHIQKDLLAIFFLGCVPNIERIIEI